MLAKGESLWKSGKVDSALFLLQNAADRYADGGIQDRQAYCLMRLAHIHRIHARFNESETALLKALQLTQGKALTSPPDLLAHIYLGYGALVSDKNDLKKASDAYEKAIAEASKHHPPNAKLLGTIYNDWGTLHLSCRRLDLAETFLHKSLHIYEAAGIGIECTYLPRLNLGLLYYHKLDYDKSFSYLEGLVQHLDSIPTIPNQLQAQMVYIAFGDLLTDFQYPYDALEYYQKAENLIQRRYGIYHNSMALVRQSIGNIYVRMGRLNEAQQTYQQVLMISDSLWKAPSDIRARALYALYDCLSRKKLYTDAQNYWEKSIAEAKALENTSMLYDFNWWRLFNEMDEKHYEDVIAYAREAIRIAKEDPQSDTSRIYSPYAFIGRALYHLGHYDEAQNYLDYSFRLQYKREIAAGGSKGVVDSTLLANPFNVVNALINTMCLLRKWEADTSAIALLEQAWASGQQTIQSDDLMRRRYRRNNGETDEDPERHHEIYTTNIHIAWRLYQQKQDLNYLVAAFHLADRYRALSLAESARNADAKRFADIPATLMAEEKRLNDLLTRYEQEVFDGLQADDQARLRVVRDSLLFGTKREQEKLTRRIEKDYPRYYALRYQPPTADIRQLQASLDPQTAFIEYAIDETNKTLFIFFIDNAKGLQVVVAPWQKESAEQIQELYTLTQSVWLQRAKHQSRLIELSHALYLQLIRPIAHLLSQKTRLVFVVEGDLNYLPFELLLERPDAHVFDKLPYLLRRFDVSYQHSAYTYLQTIKKPLATPPTLLAFAPVFGEENDEAGMTMRAYRMVDSTLRAFTHSGQFAPLYYSLEEVNNVARQFGSAQSEVLLHKAANEAVLKGRMQIPHRVLHLASHSFVNREYPKFSGIGCAQIADSTTHEDGILYANEIYNMNIPADLVVLSSCESGIGKLKFGEGLLGLNRAFAYAGVPNVVYSLWKVNDKATSTLMVEFYKEILAGKPYAAALRAAKLKMLENPATASPNFWSGFLLLGR